MDKIADLLAIVAAILALAAATSATFYLLVLGVHQPLYVVFSILLIGAFLLLIYFSFAREVSPAPIRQAPERAAVAAPQPVLPAQVAATPTPTIVSIARLETRDGKIIPVTGIRQVFGRRDFMGFVDPSLTSVISREHFSIFYDFRAGRFFIEDRSSTNGTLLNGAEIRGKGPVELKDGDVISPAGVLQLTFRV
ncbi:MAG: FHA domain-containing protein [Thermofilum sp.]|nr:FHA domain-containing protein [Thermofilum sp.]